MGVFLFGCAKKPTDIGTVSYGIDATEELEYIEGKDPSKQESLDAPDKKQASKITPVHFGFDSYTILDVYKSNLKELAKEIILINKPYTVSGYCDSRGTKVYNLGLGMRRAQSVANYLINIGVPSSNLVVKSYGKEDPMNPAQTPDAWAENRRVEIALIN